MSKKNNLLWNEKLLPDRIRAMFDEPKKPVNYDKVITDVAVHLAKNTVSPKPTKDRPATLNGIVVGYGQFIIETMLPTLNDYINAERTNKYKAAKIKDEATNFCSWCCRALKVDPDKRYDLMFQWHLPNSKHDPDNICYAKKFILDGMVKRGVISNDGAKNIGNFTDIFYYDGDSYVVVTLTESNNG